MLPTYAAIPNRLDIFKQLSSYDLAPIQLTCNVDDASQARIVTNDSPYIPSTKNARFLVQAIDKKTKVDLAALLRPGPQEPQGAAAAQYNTAQTCTIPAYLRKSQPVKWSGQNARNHRLAVAYRAIATVAAAQPQASFPHRSRCPGDLRRARRALLLG